MRAVIRLEVIAEPYHWIRRHRQRALVQRPFPLRKEIDIIRYGRKSLYPWVARILGLDDRYGLKREFVECVRDWTSARSDGMRGIYEYYALPPGIYEVNECVRPGESRRYFIRAEGAEYHEITREEVIECLNADSASAS